jgi:Putative peptidoglycan binding domain/HlyD family secretion protein
MTAVTEPAAPATDEAVPSPPADAEPSPAPIRGRRRIGRRAVLVGVLSTVVVAGGASYVVVDPLGGNSDEESESAEALTGTALAPVEQRTLTARSEMNGTLGYVGDADITSQLAGTITALPAVGQVISQGEVLFAVDNTPVVLLYGSVPAFRDLPAGSSTADLTGPDIQQLNAALVALGYASADDLDPTSNEWDWNTEEAVENLQDALGLDDTGELTLGQVVFAPGPVRVTAAPTELGAPIAAGDTALETSSTTPVVTVEVDVARQTEIRQGDTVTVTLPNNTTTKGVVYSVGTVATVTDETQGEEQDPVIDVIIALSDPSVAGTLDEAPVLVAVTTARVRNALVVPVTALLAMAGGGYAVEVDDGDGVRRLVPVNLGLFDDSLGLVQVTDTELQVGQQVVVPST